MQLTGKHKKVDTIQSARRHVDKTGTTTSGRTRWVTNAYRWLHRRSVITQLLSSSSAMLIGSGEAQSATLSAPKVIDRAWASFGGGPSDLVFPEIFLGDWDVESVLVNVELPLGEERVPNVAQVRRAQQEDLNNVIRYHVRFIRNNTGEVVMDRKFNTGSLLSKYLDLNHQDLCNRILWELESPSTTQVSLPGGLRISTNVLRRSEEYLKQDLLETSEFIQQLFDDPKSQEVRLKYSQTYMKYRWRQASDPEDKKPLIVATQVISDYLSPYDKKAADLASLGRPITLYHYQLSFRKDS
eukprot:jgi/Picsp_1/6812/NSC_04151-R1_protein